MSFQYDVDLYKLIFLECSTSTVSQGRQPTVIIPDCLHICSIGNKDKLFEIWSDCNSGYLLFR